MSVRSGVIIKYVLKFTDAKLTVSNDTLVGDICIDADISVKMSRGLAGCTFEIKLYDLPESKIQALADQLKAARAPAAPKPHLGIALGYLDTKVGDVIDGIYESLKTSVEGDKLIATISGREAGFYACATTPYTSSFTKNSSFADVAGELLQKAAFPPDCIEKKPQLLQAPKFKDVATMASPQFRSKKVLGILGELAQMANAELVLFDKKVFLGSPVLNDANPAAQLDSDTNLADFKPFVRELPSANDLNFPDPVPGEKMIGFNFTVLGDPSMRPAQKVLVKNIKGYDAAANPEFRIRNVEHRYSSTTGYTCVGVATKRLADGAQAQAIDAAAERSAGSAARDVNQSIKSQGFDNPVLEIVSLKKAADGYQADVFYGQAVPSGETQPSFNVAVKQDAEHIYEARPIASAFAWRKCGLVTPVYAGMKALLGHNRALASDGIVTGYLWSKEPDFAPPANNIGDWWLCLPIDFDASKAPQDATKAVNDLTGNDGLRVLELKGLKITVGAQGLHEVGLRPKPGDADVCTIAHASGATVTIKEGEIALDTGAGPSLTLSSSGITLTDGTLKVELKNGQLTIGS